MPSLTFFATLIEVRNKCFEFFGFFFKNIVHKVTTFLFKVWIMSIRPILDLGSFGSRMNILFIHEKKKQIQHDRKNIIKPIFLYISCVCVARVSTQ